jgi:8-oxo-dGTP pyrophosphatase MutT (NUDIX family)
LEPDVVGRRKSHNLQEYLMNQHNDIEVVWRPDVTVATIIPRDGRFLVVEERIRGELVVNQPAGHLEPLESLADAARRETLEETGWTVELTDLIGVYQWTRPEDGWQVLRVTFAGLPVAHDPARVLVPASTHALAVARRNSGGPHAQSAGPAQHRRLARTPPARRSNAGWRRV